MAKLNMKLCFGVLVAMVALGNNLADGCDASEVQSCFLTLTTKLVFMNKNELCQYIMQTLVPCLKAACEERVPGIILEKIVKLVAEHGIECDLSAVNGSNTVGGPPLILLAAVAVCLPLVLRPAFL